MLYAIDCLLQVRQENHPTESLTGITFVEVEQATCNATDDKTTYCMSI